MVDVVVRLSWEEARQHLPTVDRWWTHDGRYIVDEEPPERLWLGLTEDQATVPLQLPFTDGGVEIEADRLVGPGDRVQAMTPCLSFWHAGDPIHPQSCECDGHGERLAWVLTITETLPVVDSFNAEDTHPGQVVMLRAHDSVTRCLVPTCEDDPGGCDRYPEPGDWSSAAVAVTGTVETP